MRSPHFLLWTTFISGMSLMALEINASRILAPFFGTSLFVWSSIIGIVLLALSLGYFYGGKLADKKPQPEMLYGILWIVGIWLTLLPWLSTFLLGTIIQQGISSSLVIAALVVSTLLFLPPCTLMGMVSPYVLKLYTAHLKDLGGEAGKLYAISTIGSLIGTFLPALVTIPLIGSLRTTLLFAFLLLLTAALGFKQKWMLIFPLACGLLFIFAKPEFSHADSIFQTESSYSYINVYERNGNRLLQLDAPYGVHSIKRPNTILTYNYWDYYTVLPFYRPIQNTLLLGVAGGNISTLLSNYFPNMHITGVEIDPAVIAASQKYFGLDHPNLTIENADARSFLNQTSNQYDLIVLDAYHDLNIPSHLATTEFFATIKKHVANTGMLAINIAHSGSESLLDSYLAATVHTSFPFIYSVNTNHGYNTLLIGTLTPWDQNLNLDAIKQAHPELNHVWSQYPPQAITTFDTAKIQTDDTNSIELLSGQEVFQSIKR